MLRELMGLAQGDVVQGRVALVEILEADPKTDWSKVNLEALRQHLIDMLVSGTHHQAHHLAMAKGQMTHEH